MNKELIKTICEQLPYRTLKFISEMDKPYDEFGNQMIWTCAGISPLFGDLCLHTVENNDAYTLKLCKPILRRMDLTKPITHKGETSVPFLELSKINGGEDVFIDTVGICIGNGREYGYYIDGATEIIDWLDEHHFNRRGIPDELVKYVDELETDPYA